MGDGERRRREHRGAGRGNEQILHHVGYFLPGMLCQLIGDCFAPGRSPLPRPDDARRVTAIYC
jgi:hypothetical protein